MKLLLVVDSINTLNVILDEAETSWSARSQVKVVHVINAIIYSLEEIGLLSDKGTNRAHRAIGQAINVLKGTPLNISGEVIAGTGGQIIDRAKNWDAHLIVIGAHQRRGLKRLLFGSTSEIVANRAHCSVRVIRQDASRNEESLLRSACPSARSMGTSYRFEESLGWRKAA